MTRAMKIAVGLIVATSVGRAQHSVTINVREGANGNLQPVNVAPVTQTTITHCLNVPTVLPGPLAKLSSFASVDVNYSAANLGVQLDLDLVDNPTDVLLLICGLFPTCPVPIIDSCGPSVVQQYDYGTMRATLSAYSAAAGGGFSGGANYTRIAEGSWTMNETLEVWSPVAQTLELPIHISGDVLAAESFGDPAMTWGKARLEIVGSALGQAINRSIAVESQTVLPDTAVINVTDLVPVSVAAGTSTYSISLTSISRVEARAQSAGFFGTITGAATAGVNAPNSIRVGRLRAAGGGPLAAGTRVRGLQTGSTYEGIQAVPAPYRLVPGCTTSPSVLYPTAAGATVPGTFSLAARTAQIGGGASILFAGLRATTPLGCGPVTLFGQDVLIDVLAGIIELQTTLIVGGVASFSVPIPNAPTLVGVEVGLQTVNVDIPGPAIDLSTGLVVVLG